MLQVESSEALIPKSRALRWLVMKPVTFEFKGKRITGARSFLGPGSSFSATRKTITGGVKPPPIAPFVRGGLHGNQARMASFDQLRSAGVTDPPSFKCEVTDFQRESVPSSNLTDDCS